MQRRAPFVTRVLVDPDGSRTVWAVVEIDSVFRSDDRGETWTPIGVKTRWPLPYARGLAVKPDDPRVVFAGCGETTTGETGGVLRSTDGGLTWRSLRLPIRPNATLWGLATHPADAGARGLDALRLGLRHGGRRRVLAEDPARVGEIRCGAWLPG